MDGRKNLLKELFFSQNFNYPLTPINSHFSDLFQHVNSLIRLFSGTISSALNKAQNDIFSVHHDRADSHTHYSKIRSEK